MQNKCLYVSSPPSYVLSITVYINRHRFVIEVSWIWNSSPSRCSYIFILCLSVVRLVYQVTNIQRFLIIFLIWGCLINICWGLVCCREHCASMSALYLFISSGWRFRYLPSLHLFSTMFLPCSTMSITVYGSWMKMWRKLCYLIMIPYDNDLTLL